MSGCAGHRISSPFTFISYLSIGVQQSGSIIEEGDLHLRRHGWAREPGYRAGPADARKGPGDRIFVRGSGAGTGEGPDPQGGIRLPHRPHLQLPPVLQASGDPAQPGLCGEPPSGAGEARAILRQFRPDVVIGTGGYASFPMVKAAAKAGIPTAVHESNMVPGLTTEMLEPSRTGSWWGLRPAGSTTATRRR